MLQFRHLFFNVAVSTPYFYVPVPATYLCRSSSYLQKYRSSGTLKKVSQFQHLTPTKVLIELFSLGVTAEALRAIICSKSAISLQRGPVDPKFQVEGVAPTNHSFSQKTRINDLSYGI